MRKLTFLIVLFSFPFLSCDKLVEIPPNDSFLQKDALLLADDLLVSYATGIYEDLNNLLNSDAFGSPNNNISYIWGALADEFEARVVFPDDASGRLRRNAHHNTYFNTGPTDYEISDFFAPSLQAVVKCNTILELLAQKPGAVFEGLALEVRTARAIFYYYLLGVYERLPLLTSSDVNENFKQGLATRASLIDFCTQELKDILPGLSDQKLRINASPTNRAYTERINRHVAGYFLAMFHLMDGKPEQAVPLLKDIADSYAFVDDFSSKFLLTSPEHIWILSPRLPLSNPDYWKVTNAPFLHYKLVPSMLPFGGTRYFSLNGNLIADMQVSDHRRLFIDSVFHDGTWRYLPYRYKEVGRFDINTTEQFGLIRLPLVYLALVEAYFQSGDAPNAIDYFNRLGAHNYSDYVPVTTLDLRTIVQERFKESIGEMGDRWLTLKRTGLLDEVMAAYLPIKSNGEQTWDAAKMTYFPIPMQQELLNPYLK